MNDVNNGLFRGRNMQVLLRLSSTYVNIVNTFIHVENLTVKIKKNSARHYVEIIRQIPVLMGIINKD